MYIKKTSFPRAVKLPDGTIISQADLPDESIVRWVASRKALLVKAVYFELISRRDALERYDLSEEEFDSWCASFRQFGQAGLRVTKTKIYRQP